MTEENQNQQTSSREKYLQRMKERMSDVDFDSDDSEARYGAFLKYDDEQSDLLNKYRESNTKLADTFQKNPKFAALLKDVIQGEDASIAFVKYFGEDFLTSSGDEEKMQMIKKANEEYLNSVAESQNLRKTQEENLQKSTQEMQDFQAEKGLNEEQFAKFLDEIYTVLENGLEGLITKQFLETFWQGLNYQNDLQEAENVGRIEGRNEKIDLKRKKKPSELPDLSGAVKSGQQLETATPVNKDFFNDFPTE